MTAELNFAVASVEDVGFTNSDNLDGKSSTELDGDWQATCEVDNGWTYKLTTVCFALVLMTLF